MATLKRATYLLLTFPLGTVWFAVLITALAGAVGLAVTLLGFPILAGTLYSPCPSCATWPGASTPPCSRNGGWGRRCRTSPAAPRCR